MLQVNKITPENFKKYGRILTGDYDIQELLTAMEKTPCPEDVIYVPGDAELEKLSVKESFTDSLYGGLPVQIGYCNGHNNKMNAVEYHRSSEINIAVTDLILLLGQQCDIEDGERYDSSKIEAFLLPKGTMVEVFATTLHYAPCGVNGEGFRCVVVLPKDTNLELVKVPSGAGEDKLLMARNKWLIAHPEAKIEGAVNGIYGENLTVE